MQEAFRRGLAMNGEAVWECDSSVLHRRGLQASGHSESDSVSGSLL